MSDVDRVARPGQAKGRDPLGWALAFVLPLLIVAMELGVFMIEPRVLSPRNLVNILNQASYLLLFASAQMVVILTRGFDLSLGTSVSAISVASALVMTGLAADGAPMWLVVVLGLATGLGFGLLVGLFNGLLVSWLGINPFVVTLGSLNICLGLAHTISGGRPVFNVPDAFSHLLYDGSFIPGVPLPLTLAAIVGLLLYFVLGYTVFGRSLYLIGNNPRAAYLAGLPSRRYLALAYILCALLAALRLADADGADRIRRAQSRRQPHAGEHRGRRDRRRQPARRRRRHRAGRSRRDLRHHAVECHGPAGSRRLCPANPPGLHHHRRDIP